MKLRRQFTCTTTGPYEGAVFRAHGGKTAGGPALTVPAAWPVPCVEAFAAHACLTRPVPAYRGRRRERGIPRELARAAAARDRQTTHESDLRDAIDRVAGAAARAGWDRGAFASAAEAVAFFDEFRAVLVSRRATVAAGIWKTAGLDWAYGLEPLAPEITVTACRPVPARSEEARGHLARRAGRRHDALALAEGRSRLALAAAADDSSAHGIGATAAAALSGGFAGRPAGDTHLDADSDIWDLLGPEPPMIAIAADAADDLAIAEAIHAGIGPAVIFAGASRRHGRAGVMQLHDSEDGRPVPAGRTPAGAIALGRFLVHGADGVHLDIEGLCQTVRLVTVALCLMEGDGAIDLRLTDLAPVPMAHGLAYASEAGRALAGALAALVTGTAAEASAGLAARLGGGDATAASAVGGEMLAMRRALGRDLSRLPSDAACRRKIAEAACQRLEAAETAIAAHGLAAVPVTGAAPDVAMDAILGSEAHGLAPLRHLVRHHRLAGAMPGEDLYKVVSAAVPAGLRALSYDAGDIERLMDYVTGTGTLADAPGIDHDALRQRGFGEEDIEAVEAALATAQSLRAAVTPWVLGWEDVLAGLEDASLEDTLAAADLLTRLGFSDWDIEHANLHCCGALTLEGAPGLPVADLAVFDCETPQGAIGVRAVAPADRLRMAAAVQPFLTGGISLDLTLPCDTEAAALAGLLGQARAMGLAAMRLRRAGTDLTEPRDAQVAAAGTGDLEAWHGTIPAIDTGRMAAIAGRATVRVCERDDAPATAEGAPADLPSEGSGDVALAAAIAIGLRHGVPIDAYEAALPIGRPLQILAERYLAAHGLAAHGPARSDEEPRTVEGSRVEAACTGSHRPPSAAMKAPAEKAGPVATPTGDRPRMAGPARKDA